MALLLQVLLTIRVVSTVLDDKGTPADQTDDQVTISWEIRNQANVIVKTGSFTWARGAVEDLRDQDIDAHLRGRVDAFRRETARDPNFNRFQGREVTR